MSAFNSSPSTRGVGNAPRRQYITTSAFNNDFYQYTTTRNPQTFVVTGALSAVTGATAGNCPANRILRENAGRLYPDANPGVSTLLVGVYDEITGLKGFIDPNAPIFAVYNTDKSYQTPDGINPNGGATDQGPPLFTRGSVTAGTTITAGTNITATGAVTATELVVQNPVTLTQATTTALTADCSTGSYFKIVISSSDAFSLNATNVTDGQIVIFAINTTGNAGAPLITLNTNIRGLSTAGTFQVVTLLTGTLSFIGLGTTLVETGRVLQVTAA
jgi:hypothetical protein